METVCLSDLKPGESGLIVAMRLYGKQRRRLRDLGFLPGTEIRFVCWAPMGSTAAVHIKGSMFALRKQTCRQILVQRVA